jgi:hypothetical protein
MGGVSGGEVATVVEFSNVADIRMRMIFDIVTPF